MNTLKFALWICTIKLISCAAYTDMKKQFFVTSRNLDIKNIFFRKFQFQDDGGVIFYDPTFLVKFALEANNNQTVEDQFKSTNELTNIIQDPDLVIEQSEFSVNFDSRFRILSKNCRHCNINTNSQGRTNSVHEASHTNVSEKKRKNSDVFEKSSTIVPRLIANIFLLSTQPEDFSRFYNLECILMGITKDFSQSQREMDSNCTSGFKGRNSFRGSNVVKIPSGIYNGEFNVSRQSLSSEILQSELPYKFSLQSVVVNIKPTIEAWLQKTDVYNRNSQALTFMLKINRLRISSQVIRFEDKLHQSNFSLDLNFKYDRRCYLPAEEGCPFGACSSANRICKFRKYCPEDDCGIACNFEDESKCDWKWDTPKTEHHAGFHLTSGKQVNQKLLQLGPMTASGPIEDSLNQTDGHFLLLSLEESMNQSTVYHLESPWFLQSDESCYMEAKYHMYNMDDTLFKLVLKMQDHSTWVPMSILGNKRNIWESLKHNIGKFKQRFQVILEIAATPKVPSHFAIDNIRLVNCFPSPESCNKTCSNVEFQCNNSMCINRNQLCDFEKDCPNGEDELQNCHLVPQNTTCNFESGWCGWSNVSKHLIKWEITNRPSQSVYTGPKTDHTFQNGSGHYLVVNMKTKESMLTRAVLLSPVFARPPAVHYNTSSLYYNSCQLRFFYHMFGQHIGSLDVEIIPENPSKNIRFWQVSNDQGNTWHRASSPLPKIDSNYRLQITASRAVRGAVGDIAIDDISLSRECSGGGIPPSELGRYIWKIDPPTVTPPPENTTRYKFTTCSNNGSEGPTEEQCLTTYKETTLNASLSMDQAIKGVQVWTVPQTNHYTLIAKGARGGNGAILNQMTSHGSAVKVTVLLKQGEKLYILVGQEGASICEQNGKLPDGIRRTCFRRETLAANFAAALKGRSARTPSKSIISELSKINKLGGGGGGGGGATFVYKKVGNKAIPLLVAAGGGGLAYNASSSILPYGKGTNVSSLPLCGSTHQNGAGGGGGWDGQTVQLQVNVDGLNGVDRYRDATDRLNNNATKWISAGMSVLAGGGIGGQPCVSSLKWGSYGGFGGGGGGCEAGGGGGGYQGGSAHVSVSSNGEGGISYIIKGGLHPLVEPGVHNGPGELVVISAFTGCTRGCEYKCVLLDDYHTRFACVCPENWILTEDGTSCLERDSPVPAVYLIIMITVGILVFLIVGILCFCLYNRYQRQKVALLRRKVLGGPELQLSRLRAQAGPGGVLTEYNPNYEFGGETYTLTDLKEIPRENLRLVKALGQGAFGEVYQGFYKHRAGDAVEMPVAVKTLPELSSNQAEMDFLMEALIMSKFNHPNIVHFIGVCFDKHPRFIILELLAGGDLKTFLRESRPKPERASPLTMKDLLLCALDVAKGCKYLEENHFIHRDIAARNCLLTTKGPGRVVKIADFGMARDIYRADYYKKGGKAMLPVKWMPPEAFLDGIFTSKTDVWSYGVLLWEVLSLGYMPYPGRGNQDVMQLVTNGGRLEPPTNCPTPVYGIMTQCWHPMPEDRPTFTTLLERVGYCLQDPEVVNAPLPVFQRPPSSERDVTLMRPTNPDDSSCLRIVHGHRFSNAMSISTEPTTPNSSTADYLVPLTPYSFVSSTVSGTPAAADSTVSTPTEKNDNPPIPDSQSTSTLLDDDESPPATNIKQNVNSNESNPSSTVNVATKRNGIENGVTLNPISLDKSRRPAPYANVGVKKSIDLDRSDEEIRC